MTTLSIPISSELEAFINSLIKSGRASNKADAVRRALTHFAEEQAVNAVLEAQREPSLKGDIRDLMKKI
jgi:Arc/MetJ-type ribon-helix-helix transcriptional regulator